MKKQNKTNFKVKIITLPFFILLFVALLSPARGFAQNMVTLNMKNVSLIEFFNEIEKKNNIRFSYVDLQLDSKKDISIQATNEPIEQILNKVLVSKGYEYTRTGNTYAITKKTTKPEVKRKYSGLVTDDKGEPIIGATVLVDGTNVGTITDTRGQFSFEAFSEGVLHVSYIGYETSKVILSSNTKLNIRLKEDAKQLDEVVVVGYGTIRKSDLTGSVSQLKAEKTEEKAYTSIEQMMQGRVAGVQITQNSGALGGGISFSIRGANSVSGSNQPLVVIDGYPVETGEVSVNIGGDSNFAGDVPGMNALSMLNPNDIESIEILKDASATAIYGSRGANGVVMVTTKRGKEGRDKVEYSFRTDVSYIPNQIEVLNTNEYLAYSNEAYMDRNDGTFYYNQERLNEFGQINTNWQDLIFKTGVSTNHQLNVSGGDKKLKYALALGYLSQEGVVRSTSYDRGTFRLNINKEINQRFNFGFNIGGNKSLNKSVNQSTTSNDVSASVVTAALRTPPIYKAYDEESEEIAFSTGITNPLVLVTKSDDQSRWTQIMLSGFADYKITKDLTFRTRLGLNERLIFRQYYMPRGTYLGDTRNGYAYSGNEKSFDYLTENTFNYSKVYNNKHSVNAVGGYTWQSWNYRRDGVSASGFPNDNFTYYNLSSGSSFDKPVNSTIEWSLASFLGRVNYSFDKRYMLTLTARYDGSTRLAEGLKWALFPSFAVGWNLHNEQFMKSNQVINELKLRASYGQSGNQSIGVGSTLARYDYTTGVINQTVNTVYYPANMANPNLKWETTAQSNAGFDIALWKSRVTLSFDMYRKETIDLLINLPVPASTGYTVYADNAGKVENIGVEFDLGAHLLTGEFQWKINGNISFNRNKILSFNGDMTHFTGTAFGSVNSQPLHIAKVGYPIGSFYGYRISGIYQTQEEIDNSPLDPANPRPGSFKFVDISGPNGVPDGMISDFDREIIGNPYPDYIFGLNNDFKWKGFSLNIFIQGSIGQDIVNANRFYLDALTRTVSSNIREEAYLNRWTGPGTSNKYPGLRSTNQPFEGRFSDFIIEDGSYVRLKNVSFSYAFDMKRIKFIESLKVFISGNNIITFTEYTGYDPEINSRGNNSMTPGVDTGSIPQFRSYSAGFNVKF
jgi:TonB-linked SusC/RagA family outer membrane protein